MNEILEKKEKKSSELRKKFTLAELGGSLGDWGTLIPFIIGYVSIVGFNPAGIFLCIGITNLILGIKYNLPLPVEPQKTIGTVAISQKWSPNLVISTGFGTGIVWLILGFTKKLNIIVEKIPQIAVRGIQLGLGLILGWTALLLFSDNIILGLISMAIIIVLINNKRIPSAIILTILGIIIILYTGALLLSQISLGLPTFEFQIPTWENILIGMLIAGIAQLVLTLANVMIATVKLSKDLFPDKTDAIDANSLAINMGFMNMINPFLGGMPQCHGSGGLAAQYAFGARTGGSMIMEGILEIFLGLFCSNLLFLIFMKFPKAILGAMLLYTALLLGKMAFKNFNIKTAPIIILSGILCFVFNLIVGFLAGLVLYLIFKKKIVESPQIVKESELGSGELQSKLNEN